MIMKMSLIYLTMIITLAFMNMNHPLAMGLTIILQTVLICLVTGITNQTFWFSYILFLIFLGGMLVLFIYVASLASNEMFSLPSLKFFILLAPLPILLFTDPIMLTSHNNLPETNQEWTNILSPTYKLYNQSIMMLTIVLILYLFLTLIAITKITKLHSGPLRPSR
uniref:NADH-ubiquinone oxidoreductase chain 6 n=1 Tax=Atelura formicaria TaxID=459531 RepID=B5KME3_9INSE|nr:NADH dehydrogenase subunit 6 [Atelura formicaria]ABS88986.1 NADH dehydrogenase subunit 6 [Atelura formicaria]